MNSFEKSKSIVYLQPLKKTLERVFGEMAVPIAIGRSKIQKLEKWQSGRMRQS